jgi:hypothetical protein
MDRLTSAHRPSVTAEINTPGRKAAGAEGQNPSHLDLNNG